MADMPMEQAAPADEGQEGQGGSATDLLVQTGGALTKIAALFAKAPGLSPDQKKGMAQIDAMYKSLVSSLSDAAGKGGPVPAQGVSTMEAGGSDKAVPMM